MTKPGHDSDCEGLCCNPSEPGQNALQSDQKPCAEAGGHLRSQRHREAECRTVRICGGCLRDIAEIEEGVWIRTGSDECEAGGVHSPALEPEPDTGLEIYLLRFKKDSSLYWSARVAGWVPLGGNVTLFRDTGDLFAFMPNEEDIEWVRFAEVPF